jgi:PAS domain S-box-containing protein
MLAAVFYIVLTRPIVKVAEEIRRKNLTKNEKPGFAIPVELADNEIGALLTTFNKFVLGVKDADNFLKTVLDSSPTAMIISNISDGMILYANPVAQTMLGRTDADLVGSMIKDFYVKMDDQELLFEISEKYVRIKDREPLKKQELLAKHKNGTKICIDASIQLIEYEGNKVLISTFFDLTERKNAEQTLRESEEKYRNILESMEEGYYEVDLAGNFTFVNDAMCKIQGYTREELIGMNNRRYMAEDTAGKVFKAFSNIYTTGKPAKNLEWETVRNDGSKRFVETSAYLMKDSKDVPIGFRGIVWDVSEKNRLETQLQQAQRMESIGTLAGGIAHNFNNLLMGIQGNASIIFLDIDSSHPRHKNLKNIEKLVENGAKLTAQLIGYAREGKYEVKPINLNQLVEETSDTFGMTKKEITVHQELSEDLHGIEADQGQIEQILLNLYVNAVEAMPGGGGLFLKTTNVTDKDMSGKLYKANPGNYVLLTVRDTGIGMDKETRERIFEPFFTTKGLASGTGLGMASAYGIIKGHGGYIDVDSEKGKGTTFSIYLPATEKVIEQKNVLSDELVKGKGTVLLVDDEEMVLEVGKELLDHLGYEVLLAENGREALELYKKNLDKIDLVLLDMVMPVMGGGEAFDRMKEINTNVKVLLSSGYSLEGEAKEILKRGCDAFIQKPFKMEQLSQKLMEVLDKK